MVGTGFAPKLSDSTWNTWKYSLIKYRQHHKPVRQGSSFYSWHCGNHHVLSSFMMFQDSLFYHFLPFAILLRKFCWWTNVLSFPSSQNVSISPLFLKAILLGIGVQVDSFSFKHLKNIVLLPSGLHGLWWEICCHSDCFSSIGKVSFYFLAAFMVLLLLLFFSYVFSFSEV